MSSKVQKYDLFGRDDVVGKKSEIFESYLQKSVEKALGTDMEEIEKAISVSTNVVNKFARNFAVVQVRFSMFDASSVLSDDDLRIFGITDVDKYKSLASRGSKKLLDSPHFKAIHGVKSRTLGTLSTMGSASGGILPGEYLIPVAKVQAAAAVIQRAKENLSELVENYLAEHFKRDKAATIDSWIDAAQKSGQRVDMSREKLEAQYPSPSQIRGKFRVVYQIRPPMSIGDIATAYGKIELIEAAAAAREAAISASMEVREMFTGAISNLVMQIDQRRREGEEYLNGRTVNSIRRVFEQFGDLGPMIGSEDFKKSMSDLEAVFKRTYQEGERIEIGQCVEIEEASAKLLKIAGSEIDRQIDRETIIISLESDDSQPDTGVYARSGPDIDLG